MPKFVLDANVLIQAIRSAEPHAILVDWQREMAPHLYQHSTVVSEIHNDCLLAAGSRELWYTVVTYNTVDFELIASVEPQIKWAEPFP